MPLGLPGVPCTSSSMGLPVHPGDVLGPLGLSVSTFIQGMFHVPLGLPFSPFIQGTSSGPWVSLYTFI